MGLLCTATGAAGFRAMALAARVLRLPAVWYVGGDQVFVSLRHPETADSPLGLIGGPPPNGKQGLLPDDSLQSVL